ncbi:MAG: serine hydrolase domain-containing protein [Promethearchaeota archaeon]
MTEEIEIHGLCEDKFQAVKTAFAKNFRVDGDVGASFSATIDGKFVVDIWGGYADKERTRPWEKDTIVNVYSTTKAMTIISALMLVDRGQLDLDAPVAKYWPEFAQNGKEDLPVRYIFSHTSGLAGWEEKIAPEVLFDWDKAVSLLAAQKPWWEPGTKSGYHAITHGYLLGELVRRITNKSLGTFFKEEIADPLNADFHIGFGEELDHRVADLIPYKRLQPGDPGFVEVDPNSVLAKMGNPILETEITKTRAWRAAEIPAAGGHGNARSVARIASAIACGGEVDGVRLLSMKTIEKAMEEQSYGPDLVMIIPIRFGLGFGLPSKEMPFPSSRTLYWGGAGGSVIVMDLDKKLSYSFVMNKMKMTTTGDLRSARLMRALYAALE